MARALAGDRAAQATIFEAHKKPVARQLIRVIGDATPVEDLVQEVFISAFENLHRFRGDARLGRWLSRIASNRARSWLARRHRLQLRELRGVAPAPDPMVDAPDRYLEAGVRLQDFFDVSLRTVRRVDAESEVVAYDDFPQVVLLDLNLPRLGGLDVLHEIRSHDETKLLPVVILTSSSEDKDLLGGYERGANSYIVKPVDFTQFSDSVRQLGLYWLVLNRPVPTPA